MPGIDLSRGVGFLYPPRRGSIIIPPRPPSGTWPNPEARGPLPPFDPTSTDPDTGAVLPVYTQMTAVDLEMIANLWSVTVPGCPPIPGGASGPAQERILSYLFDRYPREWQDKYLDIYCRRGYTALWRSIPDSIVGSGQSEDAYVDDTKRIQDMGREPAHFVRSKYYDDPNDLDKYWGLIEKLVKIGGFKWAAHAWEASLWMSPLQFRRMIDSDAGRLPDTNWVIHLQQAYADFGPNGDNHSRIFWEANFRVGVRRLAYQYVTSWTAGMMAARGNDVSVRCGPGGPWGLSEEFFWWSFELLGMCQFNNVNDGDGRPPDEDHGDLKGYENACTPGPHPPKGLGNGGRMPDGAVISLG